MTNLEMAERLRSLATVYEESGDATLAEAAMKEL